ncbi:hypothetical protein CEE37_14255 [candidate division LCP-89 bacterium B3_LCP]|uniref:eRF1 domain-containing protein n=1 Tax=candidate division LCP-89 bacterium B3_LCP TaxID=2012998 RepID=A0A532UR39_UNCL8|nr:MAG: hypothetical protein CEE37_14255 [candidate division LCP-89 bacterium B3_LCP]
MITYTEIEDLLDFQSERQPIISFYLNTDGSRFSLDEQKVSARNLVREGRKTTESSELEDDVRMGLTSDLDKIEKYLDDELTRGYEPRGLAIFACMETGLWRVVGLPRPVPSLLVMEQTLHVRPLTLILDEYHRYGVLLLDKSNAELYEVYIGEIIKLDRAFKTEEAGLKLSTVDSPGSADRGKSKKEEEDLQKHFRRVSETLFHLYHRRHYEYLVLGGQQQLLGQFENFMHPALKEHLVGRFSAEPGKTHQSKILEDVVVIERNVETIEEKKLVKQLVDSAHSRGLGVIGLDDTVHALQMGAVHILLVQDGWHTPGIICRNCGLYGIEKKKCPGCGSDTTQVADMVDEVIEAAIKTGSIIEHVHPDAGLAEHGKIGAILRFSV